METSWNVVPQRSTTNTLFAERWGGSDFSTSGAGTSKAKFRGSCWTALTYRGRFRRTNMASSDDELQEDFLSGEEFASPPR